MAMIVKSKSDKDILILLFTPVEFSSQYITLITEI